MAYSYNCPSPTDTVISNGRHLLEKDCNIRLRKFVKDNLYANGFAETKKDTEGEIETAGYKWNYIGYNCSVNDLPVAQNYYSCEIDGRIATIIVTGIKGNVKENENTMKLFKEY